MESPSMTPTTFPINSGWARRGARIKLSSKMPVNSRRRFRDVLIGLAVYMTYRVGDSTREKGWAKTSRD